MPPLVFAAKPEPAYDDLLWQRYHFPETYLNVARTGIGSLVVYYEPRRPTALERAGGRQCYFASAQLDDIKPDPVNPGNHYAYVSRFMQFAQPVPYRKSDFFYESLLRKPDGSVNRGRFGRSIRSLQPGELDVILSAAFPTPPSRAESEEEHEIPESVQRPILEVVLHRPFRDIMFRRLVRSAYMGTCAMTGLNLLNGGGSIEVEGAHIRPVAKPHAGPDSVRNGLALSRTFHWLFDHGCISIEDDFRILVSPRRFPDKLRPMLNADGKLHVPKLTDNQPHRQFLKYHREHIFKG